LRQTRRSDRHWGQVSLRPGCPDKVHSHPHFQQCRVIPGKVTRGSPHDNPSKSSSAEKSIPVAQSEILYVFGAIAQQCPAGRQFLEQTAHSFGVRREAEAPRRFGIGTRYA